MASSVQTDPLVFQKFESEDGSALSSLRTHVCTETKERYLLWTDIQHAFHGIDHLEVEDVTMVLFTVDADGELYVLKFEKTTRLFMVLKLCRSWLTCNLH